MNEITVLNQVGSDLSLYVNGIKNGFTSLKYFSDPDHIAEISLQKPEIILHDLVPGEYSFYLEDKEENQAGYKTIQISNLEKDTIFQNILTCAGLTDPFYVETVSKLDTTSYIEQLYTKAKKDSSHQEEYDALLKAFVTFYNLRQEEMNLFVEPEFTITDSELVSKNSGKFTFIPYTYDIEKEKWILLPEQIEYNTDFYSIDGKPRIMYLIAVLSDFSVIRKYFVYRPSKTLSETILARRIKTKQLEIETIGELTANIDLTNFAEDTYGQKIVAALLRFQNTRPIFKKPVIILEQNKIHVTVPDFKCISLLNKPIYLAALELKEVYAEKHIAHRCLIAYENFSFNPSELLLNSDTEYIFYLTDDTGKVLSNLALLSLDDTQILDTYISSYQNVVFDDYSRKLYNIFREYNKRDWETVSLSLSIYKLINNPEDTLYEYMLKQLLKLDEQRERIDYLIQLITLCQLTYYTDIDQTLIQHQVYSKDFKSHVFPEREDPYIIKVTRIYDTDIRYEYILAGAESTSVRIDQGDYILLQCIDPSSWTMSSIAFYNNKIKNGRPYFYFPKLEVEVI